MKKLYYVSQTVRNDVNFDLFVLEDNAHKALVYGRRIFGEHLICAQEIDGKLTFVVMEILTEEQTNLLIENSYVQVEQILPLKRLEIMLMDY